MLNKKYQLLAYIFRVRFFKTQLLPIQNILLISINVTHSVFYRITAFVLCGYMAVLECMMEL